MHIMCMKVTPKRIMCIIIIIMHFWKCYMINKLRDTFQYTKKHNTILRKTFSPEKKQLPQVGLKPTTLCSLESALPTELLR